MRMGDVQSVEVIVTEPAPIYFASLFLNSVPQITARAVAKAVVADACVWALHPTAMGALTVSGTADVHLGCGVMVNSNDPVGGAQPDRLVLPVGDLGHRSRRLLRQLRLARAGGPGAELWRSDERAGRARGRQL